MLNEDAVGEHVRCHYDIEGEVTRVRRGRADNYVVCDGRTRWLLKVFQTEYTAARIEQAADFLGFVVGQGYPSRSFVRTRNGTPVVTVGGRASVLVPWIAGDTPEPNSISSPTALRQVGALCGWLHRIAASYPGAAALDYAGSKRSIEARRSALQRVAEQQRADAGIVAEVAIRSAILASLGEELLRSHERARDGVIHGDFHASHVVFRGDEAVGVIDVLGERYLPGWELMRGFFQSVPFPGGKPIEILWRAYLSGYASQHPIAPEEVAVAYDAYLLQLASSTYGLRPPLDADLRAFGGWRTRVAEHLAAHRGELRKVMSSVLG